MMMVFNFLVTCAVPPNSLCAPAAAAAPVAPYFLTGSSQAFSTFHNCRARVSSYAS
jgi:hypothetical protein